MKSLLLFFCAVVVTAAISAFITQRVVAARAEHPADAHTWLHRELHLTTAQKAQLEPIEAQFTERERTLAEQLRGAERDLARVLAEQQAFTPEVGQAVEMVHHRMGDLQKASIEHLYAMRAVLTPEQNQKLLRFAQSALEQSP